MHRYQQTLQALSCWNHAASCTQPLLSFMSKWVQFRFHVCAWNPIRIQLHNQCHCVCIQVWLVCSWSKTSQYIVLLNSVLRLAILLNIALSGIKCVDAKESTQVAVTWQCAVIFGAVSVTSVTCMKYNHGYPAHSHHNSSSSSRLHLYY